MTTPRFNLSDHIREVVATRVEPDEMHLLLSVWARQGIHFTAEQRGALIARGALPSTVLRLYRRHTKNNLPDNQ